jgi:hypothetical protein
VIGNNLCSLPDELSSLRNLKKLVLRANNFAEPPVHVLSGLTAITSIDLQYQGRPGNPPAPTFKIPSPLLPILHPGLVKLVVRQETFDHSIMASLPIPWDDLSLSHLGRALAHVADRKLGVTIVC